MNRFERLKLYEREHGPVQNPYPLFALFALVSQDPAFQWLQPLTKPLVELEELRDLLNQVRNTRGCFKLGR